MALADTKVAGGRAPRMSSPSITMNDGAGAVSLAGATLTRPSGSPATSCGPTEVAPPPSITGSAPVGEGTPWITIGAAAVPEAEISHFSR